MDIFERIMYEERLRVLGLPKGLARKIVERPQIFHPDMLARLDEYFKNQIVSYMENFKNRNNMRGGV